MVVSLTSALGDAISTAVAADASSAITWRHAPQGVTAWS